jgi:arginyl-tRNA synthetase
VKKFKEEVLNILSSNLEGFDNSILATPPDSTLGDLALPCFKFAKGINPLDYAKNFSNLLNTKLSKYNFIKEIKAVGPYVNFFINREKLLYDIIKNGFLINNENVNKTVVIDYSSPNIAKPIAFHHIRSTVIGHVLGNIFEACGYKVVRINYLGDWGTQFGKIITAFEKYGDYKTLEKEGIKHLLDIYVKYHKEEDEALELEAQKWYELTEKADEKALKYWEKFRDISIKEFKRIYKKLNIDFTFFEGESFYRHSTDKVLDLLDKKIGIKESEGALIIDLSKYDMPPALLKKTNGQLYI